MLDIDLDFFVTPPVHWPSGEERPSASQHSVWSPADAIGFLRDRCGLNDRLPGFLTENHGELFHRWRDAIRSGQLKTPFHVSHLDAHADLGLGDAGYDYLMTSLLFAPVEDRWHPIVDPMTGLTDGNFLLFAIACRWIGELVYVYGEGGGADELSYAMEGFEQSASHVQLAAMPKTELNKLLYMSGAPSVAHLEPRVPYRSTRWESFNPDEKYDFVCLTRSPPYTPSSADILYEEIRSAFVDPI